MLLKDYLKEQRERCNLTQAQAAEKIGVTTNTIQNWEYGKAKPDECFWDNLIKEYNLDKNIFNKLYMKTSEESIVEKRGNIPTFLFNEEMLEEIMKLELTEEEQELLGLETLYEVSSLSGGGTYEGYGTLSFCTNTNYQLPYYFVKERGAFYVLNLRASLNGKLGRYREFVTKYLIKNPSEIFSVHNLTPKDYLDLYYYPSIYLGRNSKNIAMLRNIVGMDSNKTGCIIRDKKMHISEFLPKMIELLEEIKDEKTFILASKRKDFRDYTLNLDKVDWAWMKKYLSLLITDLTSKYIEIFESEIAEDEFLEAKIKYDEAKKFYDEHKDVINMEEPKAPIPKEIIYVRMTKEGEELLNWYNTYIKKETLENDSDYI